MQTINLFETIKWIDSLYSKTVKEFLLENALIWDYLHGTVIKKDNPFHVIFEVTHELAVVRERLLSNPVAVQILKSFNLDLLIDSSFPIVLAEATAIQIEREKNPPRMDITNDISNLIRNWRTLVGCQKPLEGLLIPAKVRKEEDFDEILTIEVRYSEDINPQAKKIAELLSNAAKLYEAVCIASGYEDYPPLSVTYVGSGSSVRFDLSGLGSPIKQIKLFFVDFWNLVRHRKTEDFHHKGKAIVEGLDILERIDKSHRKAAISTEEANRLRLQINRAMLGIFEVGALTREVPDFEIVPNRDLMQGIQQKLLPPASSPDGDSSKSSKVTAAKQKSRSNQKRKNRRTDQPEDPDNKG